MYYSAPLANLIREKENIFNAVNNPSFCICTSNNTSLTAVICVMALNTLTKDLAGASLTLKWKLVENLNHHI
jgi:hypothetical protein